MFYVKFGILTAVLILGSAFTLSAQTFHVITAGNWQTEEQSECVQQNIRMVKYFFQQSVPVRSLKFYDVRKNDLTRQDIESILSEVNPLSCDVLFFYLASPAAQGENADLLLSSNAADAQSLTRNQMKEILTKKAARLYVLFTDLIGVWDFSQYLDAQLPLNRYFVKNTSPFLQEFFLKSSGMLDISSAEAKNNEVGVAMEDGSFFTLAWFITMNEMNDQTKPNERANWGVFEKKLKENSNQIFRKYYPLRAMNGQRNQTPLVAALPSLTRLGVTVRETRNKNVEIIDIYDGFAGEKAGLRNGDIIISINGEEIKNEKDYAQIMAQIVKDDPENFEIVFRREGKEQTVTLNLNGPVEKPLIASNTNLIETDEIETDEIETDEIETDEIETDEIETDEIETDEIETDEIEADEIEADEIEADEIEADEIEADEIEADEIETDEIETDEIEADEIEADEIEAEEIEADEIEVHVIETNEIEVHEIEAEEPIPPVIIPKTSNRPVHPVPNKNPAPRVQTSQAVSAQNPLPDPDAITRRIMGVTMAADSNTLTNVFPDTPAANLELEEGDQIKKINTKEIRDKYQFAKILEKIIPISTLEILKKDGSVKQEAIILNKSL